MPAGLCTGSDLSSTFPTTPPPQLPRCLTPAAARLVAGVSSSLSRYIAAAPGVWVQTRLVPPPGLPVPPVPEPRTGPHGVLALSTSWLHGLLQGAERCHAPSRAHSRQHSSIPTFLGIESWLLGKPGPEALLIHGSRHSIKLICRASSSGSPVGVVLPSREHLVAMSGDVSGCHHGEGGSFWHLAG